MVNHECHTKLTHPCSVTDIAPQTATALFELHLHNIHQQRHTLEAADLMAVQCHWITGKACAMYLSHKRGNILVSINTKTVVKQLFRNILILYWQSKHKNQTIHKKEDSLVQIWQYSIKLPACSNKLFNYLLPVDIMIYHTDKWHRSVWIFIQYFRQTSLYSRFNTEMLSSCADILMLHLMIFVLCV